MMMMVIMMIILRCNRRRRLCCLVTVLGRRTRGGLFFGKVTRLVMVGGVEGIAMSGLSFL